MKKHTLNPEALRDRLDCFGDYTPHDTICLKWCHLNIRCAIAKDQHQQIEIMEDFFDTVLETSKSQ